MVPGRGSYRPVYVNVIDLCVMLTICVVYVIRGVDVLIVCTLDADRWVRAVASALRSILSFERRHGNQSKLAGATSRPGPVSALSLAAINTTKFKAVFPSITYQTARNYRQVLHHDQCGEITRDCCPVLRANTLLVHPCLVASPKGLNRTSGSERILLKPQLRQKKYPLWAMRDAACQIRKQSLLGAGRVKVRLRRTCWAGRGTGGVAALLVGRTAFATRNGWLSLHLSLASVEDLFG